MVHEIAPFPEIFPRRVYHPQMESRIVKNKAELLALGSGWQSGRYPDPESEPAAPVVVAAAPELHPMPAAALPKTRVGTRARKAELS